MPLGGQRPDETDKAGFLWSGKRKAMAMFETWFMGMLMCTENCRIASEMTGDNPGVSLSGEM